MSKVCMARVTGKDGSFIHLIGGEVDALITQSHLHMVDDLGR